MDSNYQRGEIINVDLGKPPQEVKGHEQGYDRPCIIIKSFNYLGLSIVVPCTSKEPKQNHYTIVKLPKGTGGLISDSFVLCHQIRTISHNRILKRIGQLKQIDFLKIHSVLIDMLDI